MQDQDYATAIEAIDRALQAQDVPTDQLLFLKGRALYFGKSHDAAVATFEELIRRFPDSPWRRQARFGAAVALVHKGDFRAAELIYRAEAESLLSAERKQTLAALCLDLADAYYQPQEADQDADYRQALGFYEKALEIGLLPDSRCNVEFRAARCRQQIGENDRAAKLFEEFVANHADHPQAVQAGFRRGECLLAQGEPTQARRVWQDLLAAHGDSKSEWLAEASYQLSRTWGIPQPGTDPQLELGVAALEAFLQRFPTHQLAAQALLDIAGSLMHRVRNEDAIAWLEKLLGDDRYRNHEAIPRGRVLRGHAYHRQEKFVEALAAWKEYLAEHPADAQWSEVQQLVIDTEYALGLQAYESRAYDQARQRLNEFLAKYPLDRRAAGILVLFGRMHYEQKEFEAAIERWRRVVSKYPDRDESSYAQYMIGVTLQQDLHKFEDALEAYRKVTWGKHATEARQAVARLSEKSLTVATERVFRSNETPRLKLTTRNIESVTVRTYKVDLESYFRKTQAADGIENLDVALIAPAEQFEFEIPKYAEYQELENGVDVPLPAAAKAGAMAVTVSTETLEATTLVIQSDLDIIVKASGDEVFVFAENMVDGKPWTGARLLISDGKQILAEGASGDDGVFRALQLDLDQSDEVRVLAIAEGHVASNLSGLKPLGVSHGLADKGYIYTDRPAYRAGQRVFVRGWVRQVAEDAYVFAEGQQYTLDVLDPRNRILWREQVALGSFGGFAAEFALPSTCPQGVYRIRLHDVAGHRYQGTFQVQEYKLEPVRIVIDTPRTVYYRGEEIEGMIRAEYYYGTPLAGRTITYQLAGDRRHVATTDANGEVAFRLPTREFTESATLSFVVELAERNLQTTANFYLAVQEFSLHLSTHRDVCIAGETFEVAVTAKDAEGTPVARPLTLKVFQLTTVDGKVGERVVDQWPVETAAADGVARHTLKLDKGGNYRLRAEGVDRFGNPVSGQHGIRISDEEDHIRLHILADRHTYKAGDSAEITVLWREKPALALVTFQGAGVLNYRLVELKTGTNKLPIVMLPKFAPNFDLTVAVMTDQRPGVEGDGPERNSNGAAAPLVRFHEASSPFVVERDLSVAVSYRRKEGAAGLVRPGDEFEVTVTTTDPQGNPVAAEVSLAMVEQALLERFPWPLPAIDEFFRGARREAAIRTTSSVTFAYRPETRSIHPRLLTEQQRRELAQQEAASLERSFGPRRGPGGGGFGVGFGGMGGMGGMGGFGAAFGGYPSEASAAGNASAADFDALIELIQRTVPSTWEDVGGPGELPSFPAYLSLEVSQTQEVTEQDRPPADAAGLAAARLAERFLEETGYWNPAVVTGQDGRAVVTFIVPDRITAWTLVARGITVGTLAGETTAPLIARKAFFGELKLPSAFTAGDEAEVIATVHNDAVDEGIVEVNLRADIAGRTVEETKRLPIQGKGIHEVPFRVKLDPPKSSDDEATGAAAARVVFQLTVAADQHRDVLRRSVSLKPYGMTVYATAGGSADADTTVWVESPADMVFADARLQILIGPTIDRSLLDVIFGPTLPCGQQSRLSSTDVETASSDLLAAIGLQKMFAAAAEGDNVRTQVIDERIRAAIGDLISAQNADGGWGWTWAGDASDRYTSARVLWSLALARRAGYVVPGESYEKLLRYVTEQVAATGNRDFVSKAILLHALSTAGRGDFSLANRLYRERPSLSAAALLHLALAFAEMDRRPIAAELVGLAAKRDEAAAAGDRCAAVSGEAELQALHALAVQAATGRAAAAGQLVDWLLAHRRGHRWSPDKATGPAALAICQWFAETPRPSERYRLAVSVNDTQVAELDVDATAPSHVIDVPQRLLTAGKQRVRFQITGRGRFTYQALLSGFVPADGLQSTTTNWSVQRWYEPAPLERDGREVPRGFHIVRPGTKPFRNPLTQLPVGRRAQVELRVLRHVSQDTPAHKLEYLVITEPIPSGASVVEPSVRGAFQRFEIEPGAIKFYVGNRRNAATIGYELYGYLPGSYRTAPTIVQDAYRLGELAVSQPKAVTILPVGKSSDDPYRLSPVELYELGRMAWEKGDLEKAESHLTELVTEWDVEPRKYKSVVEMLLDVHLGLGKAVEVVRYFEILREKWPEERIPFDKIVKIGAAYHELGEFERSYLVFRATVESNFTLETGLAGFLASRDRFLLSVDVMERLLREYPPEPYAAAARYALAQQVLAEASRKRGHSTFSNRPMTSRVDGNEKVECPLFLCRVDLTIRAWRMLEDFLTVHAEDPAADQAAFSTAGALLELGRYQQAADACERYAKRYPSSRLLDSFWYIIGYCRFADGQPEPAREMLERVAASTRTDAATGRTSESPNRWPALYILGQVFHSLDQPDEAIRYYRMVEDRFPDAKKSIAYFLRKAIRVPEVTTIRPGQPIEVELAYRNSATCDVRVYRIDLMKFALLQQDLSGITQIHLAGIEPHLATTVRLGDGRDYRDRTHPLRLELRDEGAYLVVCRGDDRYASGLVLITPLEVEVQHDPDSQEVRATVRDVVADRYLNDVEVKIAGSVNADFVTGRTDRRGLFVAQEIAGAPTVIAQAGPGRYAFHRSREATASPSLPIDVSGVRGRVQSPFVLPDFFDEDPFAERPKSAGIVVAGPGQNPMDRRIERALDTPTAAEFHETPLSDVAKYLQQRHGIPVRLDERALDDVGIATDIPITFTGRGLSLRSALRLMLRELDLTYQTRDESLVITTPEEAEYELTTVVYPVTDLVRFRDSEGKVWSDFDTLIDSTTSTIAPVTWDMVGGPGSIEGATFRNTDVLIVSQTQEVHRQIAPLLTKLRSLAGSDAGGDELPVKDRPTGPSGMGDPFGGYGGMGGMGGMGGGFFGGAMPSGAAADAGGAEAGQPAQPGLLKGLQDAYRELQGKEIEKLQRMYNQGQGMGGMGGVGAGGVF
jgi:uncharacterized protein YfaS (alpha-2-macroglobulin family)/TolA-binding protein